MSKVISKRTGIVLLVAGVVMTGWAIYFLFFKPPDDFNKLPMCQDKPNPQAGYMVFVAAPSANESELIRATLNGSRMCRLTDITEPSLLYPPAIAPDGSHILYAFASSSVGVGGVYQIGTDGTNTTLLNTEYFDNIGTPSWSPDGKQMVFSATISEHQLPTGEIGVTANDDSMHDLFVMSREGDFLYQVISDPFRQFYPTWSPDGTQIAFLSDPDGDLIEPYNLYVVDAGGGTPRLLTDEPGQSVSWSPDSKQLVAQGNSGLFIITVSDGSLTTLTGDYGEWPVWANDEWIYYTADGRVYRIQSDGSRRTALTPDYSASGVDVWVP